MIRATTGGVLKSYRTNLMNSFIGMNKSRDTVLSQRNFNTYAEDPAAAARAFRLRKARMTVDSQHTICSDTLKKYQTAYSCLQSMDEALDTETASPLNTIKGMTLKWLNDPTGDAREQLTKALDQMSQILVQDMNQKYGDNFIFAGADGHNVPFEIEDNKLYYRGVSVDAAVPNVVSTGTDAKGDPIPMEINATATPPVVSANGGSYVKMDTSALIKKDDYDQIGVGDPAAVKPTILIADDTTTPPTPQAFDADGNPVDGTYTGDIYYLNMDKAETMTTAEYDEQKLEAEKLEYLKTETNYVDIGLGFQENDKGNLISSSGFNAALNGINFFGCGLDEDGDPKNIYSLVQKLTKVSDSVPSGGDWTPEVWDEFDRLVGKLETASSDFKTEFTNMAASTTKLENNEKLLEDNFYNLQEQYADLEDVDMVDSITSFIWAQYCYNAALKVGNNILSESLMDYLT